MMPDVSAAVLAADPFYAGPPSKKFKPGMPGLNDPKLS